MALSRDRFFSARSREPFEVAVPEMGEGETVSCRPLSARDSIEVSIMLDDILGQDRKAKHEAERRIKAWVVARSCIGEDGDLLFDADDGEDLKRIMEVHPRAIHRIYTEVASRSSISEEAREAVGKGSDEAGPSGSPSSSQATSD